MQFLRKKSTYGRHSSERTVGQKDDPIAVVVLAGSNAAPSGSDGPCSEPRVLVLACSSCVSTSVSRMMSLSSPSISWGTFVWAGTSFP